MATATFEQLVTAVVAGLRDLGSRETVELGVIHGFCVDAAHDKAPTLVAFISSVEGLQAISAQLSRMPDVVTSVGVNGALWQFVGANSSEDPGAPVPN